jgi:hypothetical protein
VRVQFPETGDATVCFGNRAESDATIGGGLDACVSGGYTADFAAARSMPGMLKPSRLSPSITCCA